ncbi:MAG: hypothetical protein NTW93_07085 [Phycisphaerae bacterium]|nr:hypothetical protein [Phycisphaerae bacterium]
MNPVRDKTSSIPDSRCKRPISNGMKIHNRIILFVLPAVLLLLSCEDNWGNSSLSKIVKRELDRYPGQRLVDIYKTFFQGFFGPAHLITDANEAVQYTKQELAEANDFEDYDFYPLPPDDKFVRMNLKLIKNNKISLDDFTEIFVKSAKPVGKADIEKWKKRWPKILSEIEKQKPDMPNFQRDKAFIEGLLAKNEYVVDHSEEFIAKYHPHYRVINTEQLKNILQNRATR